MRLAAILVAVALSSGCRSSGPGSDDRIDARWRPRAGDIFAVKMQLLQEGGAGAGTAMMAGDLRILEVATDGKARGTYQLVRLELRSKGEESPTVLYEDGALKVWKEKDKPELDKLARPLPIILEPSGRMHAEVELQSWNPMPFDALGVWLPGRKVAPGEKWAGRVRAAYSDWVEVEYHWEADARRARILGRSTAKAEEEHRILIRSEGTFLSAEGYVSEAYIDIDFSRLNIKARRRVSYEIRRQ